ncbi:uncharacterized protein LOC101853979 [Aplysia californica]|uniref:Uncharacterized protein LOC101853979 n=1 Tax=Aplysia californica TaxID=6500 RepID=A0ABM0K7I1_APLCA|nr:uncharacterized protein LOC101853979 [Aplysia californica]
MAAVASGNEATGREIPVVCNSTEDAIQSALHDDPDLQQIVSRLDSDVNIDPDRDLNIEVSSDTSDSLNKDSDSVSTSSSLRDTDDNLDDDHSPTSERKTKHKQQSHSSDKSPVSNGDSKKSDRKQSVDSTGKSSLSVKSKAGSSDGSQKSSSKNPLKMLKKLTKFDKPEKQHADYKSEFAAVVVDRLPQVFVVKYLGHRRVTGVCGLHHVRRPVDEMVKEVKDKLDQKSDVELPLLYVVVSPKGLDLREHKRNKVESAAPLGLMPIDFISYGVQDIKFWRVFTCIVVRELSARTRAATCHAFLCDSAHNGRKMALALGAAFNLYSKKLKSAGKVHNFQIELRPPDELADAVDAECDA